MQYNSFRKFPMNRLSTTLVHENALLAHNKKILKITRQKQLRKRRSRSSVLKRFNIITSQDDCQENKVTISIF